MFLLMPTSPTKIRMTRAISFVVKDIMALVAVASMLVKIISLKILMRNLIMVNC